jgi:hypothetical protein
MIKKSGYKIMYISAILKEGRKNYLVSNFLVEHKHELEEKIGETEFRLTHYFSQLLSLENLLYGAYLTSQDFNSEQNRPKWKPNHNFSSSFERMFKVLDENQKESLMGRFKNRKELNKILNEFGSDFNKMRYPYQYMEYSIDDSQESLLGEVKFQLNSLSILIGFMQGLISSWIEKQSLNKCPPPFSTY